MSYKGVVYFYVAFLVIELLYLILTISMLFLTTIVVRRRRKYVLLELEKIQIDPISRYLYIKKAKYPKKILGKDDAIE